MPDQNRPSSGPNQPPQKPPSSYEGLIKLGFSAALAVMAASVFYSNTQGAQIKFPAGGLPPTPLASKSPSLAIPSTSPFPTPQSQARQTPLLQPPTPQVSQKPLSVIPTIGLSTPRQILVQSPPLSLILKPRLQSAIVPTEKNKNFLNLSNYEKELREVLAKRNFVVPSEGGLSSENIDTLFTVGVLSTLDSGKVKINEVLLGLLLEAPQPTPTPSPTTRP